MPSTIFAPFDVSPRYEKNPRKISADNVSCETILLDKQALEICETLTENSFAQDLVRKSKQYGLSAKQIVWSHKLAMESWNSYFKQTTPTPPNPELKVANPDDMSQIQALFSQAIQNGAKRPKIRLRLQNRPFSLSPASATSNNAGSIYVKGGIDYHDAYFGKIIPSGVFVPARSCDGNIIRLLKEFALNPVKIAQEYGQQTNTCCFCGRELTDDISVKNGFGKVCATLYGLEYR